MPLSRSVITERWLVRWNHGTRYGYVHGGCRCAACRLAQSDYMRLYRSSGREVAGRGRGRPRLYG